MPSLKNNIFWILTNIQGIRKDFVCVTNRIQFYRACPILNIVYPILSMSYSRIFTVQLYDYTSIRLIDSSISWKAARRGKFHLRPNLVSWDSLVRRQYLVTTRERLLNWKQLISACVITHRCSNTWHNFPAANIGSEYDPPSHIFLASLALEELKSITKTLYLSDLMYFDWNSSWKSNKNKTKTLSVQGTSW